MKYVATIRNGVTTESRMFNTVLAAEQWLDTQNNNLECDTFIDEYDDNWQKKDGFFYTRKAE